MAEEENGKNEIAGWVVTFSDLMTLLLTFFVLMLSMSSLDRQNVSRIFSILPGKSGILNREAWVGNKELPDKEWKYNRLSELIDQISALERSRNSKIQPGDVKIVKRDEGFVFIIANRILFSSGKATLSRSAKGILKLVSSFLKQCSNEIAIDGHTDNIPIHNSLYPSNWELSAARALSVFKYFVHIRGLPPTRFKIGAFGDSRPVVPNISEYNRSRNRRIEITILNNKNGEQNG